LSECPTGIKISVVRREQIRKQVITCCGKRKCLDSYGVTKKTSHKNTSFGNSSSDASLMLRETRFDSSTIKVFPKHFWCIYYNLSSVPTDQQKVQEN
jgi:hypothetical protein